MVLNNYVFSWEFVFFCKLMTECLMCKPSTHSLRQENGKTHSGSGGCLYYLPRELWLISF